MLSDNLRVFQDDDIIMIDFGHELISETTMKEAIRQHENLTGVVKGKVLIQGQGALDLDGKIKELSASKRVVDISEAVAIVPTSKLGYILASLFMKIMKNPYPTKVFPDTDSAKIWLKEAKY